jgi:hypothetical protein
MAALTLVSSCRRTSTRRSQTALRMTMIILWLRGNGQLTRRGRLSRRGRGGRKTAAQRSSERRRQHNPPLQATAVVLQWVARSQSAAVQVPRSLTPS